MEPGRPPPRHPPRPPRGHATQGRGRRSADAAESAVAAAHSPSQPGSSAAVTTTASAAAAATATTVAAAVDDSVSGLSDLAVVAAGCAKPNHPDVQSALSSSSFWSR